MTELLPCPLPWCNSIDISIFEPEHDFLNREIWMIRCNECDLCSPNYPIKEQCIEDWNTRASPWVKTSEKEPEDKQQVLFVFQIWDERYKEFGRFNKERNYFMDSIGNTHGLGEVKYWMPAPSLPGED